MRAFSIPGNFFSSITKNVVEQFSQYRHMFESSVNYRVPPRALPLGERPQEKDIDIERDRHKRN